MIFLAATTVAVTALTAVALQRFKPSRSDPVIADADALRKYRAARHPIRLLEFCSCDCAQTSCFFGHYNVRWKHMCGSMSLVLRCTVIVLMAVQ